jgi:hypothetical protein
MSATDALIACAVVGEGASPPPSTPKKAKPKESLPTKAEHDRPIITRIVWALNAIKEAARAT